MATFNVTTTPAQDAAAQRFVNQLNASNPAPVPLWTPLSWARSIILARLDQLVLRYQSDDNVSKATLYQRATPEDQASIDAILAKYQTE